MEGASVKRLSVGIAVGVGVLAVAVVVLRGTGQEAPLPASETASAPEPKPKAQSSESTLEEQEPARKAEEEADEAAAKAAGLDEQDLDRLEAARVRRGDVSVEEFKRAQSEPMWKPVDNPPEHLPVSEEERNDGRAFIEFNRLKLDSLQEGDKLPVSVPQLGRDYTIQVNEVKTHESGIVSWNGRLEGMPPSYTTSITQGPKHTHGGITTPEGHYTLEVHGNDGWIVATDTIYQQDPDQPDVLTPPEPGKKEGKSNVPPSADG